MPTEDAVMGMLDRDMFEYDTARSDLHHMCSICFVAAQ